MPEREGAGSSERHTPSVNERSKDVLKKPREKLEIDEERGEAKDQKVEKHQ